MADWEVVAEGTSFWSLKETIGDFEMPKGTRMRVVMKTSMPWLFDMAGVEFIFKPFVPENMKLIDVWGEEGNGIVEMEVTGTPFLAVLAFLKAHWLAVAIAGILLYTVISFIWVMAKVPTVAQIPIWLILGAAGGVLVLAFVAARGGRSPPRR